MQRPPQDGKHHRKLLPSTKHTLSTGLWTACSGAPASRCGASTPPQHISLRTHYHNKEAKEYNRKASWKHSLGSLETALRSDHHIHVSEVAGTVACRRRELVGVGGGTPIVRVHVEPGLTRQLLLRGCRKPSDCSDGFLLFTVRKKSSGSIVWHLVVVATQQMVVKSWGRMSLLINYHMALNTF